MKTTRTHQHLTIITIREEAGAEEIDFLLNSKTRVAKVEILNPTLATRELDKGGLIELAERTASTHNIPLHAMVLARIIVSAHDGTGKRAEWCPGLR